MNTETWIVVVTFIVLPIAVALLWLVVQCYKCCKSEPKKVAAKKAKYQPLQKVVSTRPSTPSYTTSNNYSRKYKKDYSYRNSSIDLHGMNLSGAMRAVKHKLGRAAQAYRNGAGGRYLNIITGRGEHSHNGKPVIRPSVEKHLSQARYSHHRANPGMVRVDLGSC